MKWPLQTPKQLPPDEERFFQCARWHLAHRFEVAGVSGVPFPPAVYEWAFRLHFDDEVLSRVLPSLLQQDLLGSDQREHQTVFYLTERGVQYLYRTGQIDGSF